jgi:hypothetical protein
MEVNVCGVNIGESGGVESLLVTVTTRHTKNALMVFCRADTGVWHRRSNGDLSGPADKWAPGLNDILEAIVVNRLVAPMPDLQKAPIEWRS